MNETNKKDCTTCRQQSSRRQAWGVGYCSLNINGEKIRTASRNNHKTSIQMPKPTSTLWKVLKNILHRKEQSYWGNIIGRPYPSLWNTPPHGVSLCLVVFPTFPEEKTQWPWLFSFFILCFTQIIIRQALTLGEPTIYLLRHAHNIWRGFASVILYRAPNPLHWHIVGL